MSMSKVHEIASHDKEVLTSRHTLRDDNGSGRTRIIPTRNKKIHPLPDLLPSRVSI